MPPTAAKSRRTKKFAAMDIKDEGFATGPREARLRMIRSSGVLDMRTDTFVNFNMAPSTKFDTYHRILRANPPIVSQRMCATVLEKRDIEVSTDPIDMVDKEMQFTFDDETDMYNIIRCIRERRGKASGGSLLEAAGIVSARNRPAVPLALRDGSDPKTEDGHAQTLSDGGALDNGSINSLSLFLQRASHVMESLLVESDLRNRSKTTSSARRSKSVRPAGIDGPPLFDDSEWVALGQGGTSGYLEYIRNRPTLCIKFSELQPNLLLTGHPALEIESDDEIKPFSVRNLLS